MRFNRILIDRFEKVTAEAQAFRFEEKNRLKITYLLHHKTVMNNVKKILVSIRFKYLE